MLSGAVLEAAAAIGPEDTNSDATVSADVRILMLDELPVSDPMVKPRIVTVNNAAPIVAPDVVITTDVALVAPHVAVNPAKLLAPSDTLGAIDEAKKPAGYNRVKVPPEGIGVAGVKVNVTVTHTLDITRSVVSIAKETSFT